MDKKIILNLVIHGFALLHAVASATMFVLGLPDHVLLTAMTVVMLIILTRMYYYPVDVSATLILLCCFAGFYLGVQGAELLQGLMPRSGHWANVGATFMVTEILGWITYSIVRKGGKKRKVDETIH